MNYTQRIEGNCTIISWVGDVDIATAPAAHDHVLPLIEDGRNLIIDLSQVTHIDSSGIAVLVECHVGAKKSRAQFALANCSQAALEVLKLANLEHALRIHDSVQDAISELSRKGKRK
jgi:anti-sigma B factor antagonist